MKKITAVIALFSMLFMITPFVLKAQNQAKVTVTIKSLKATSVDACNEKMDFYAKIKIGGTVKTFPVKEGNLLLEPFQFTALVNNYFTGFSIEIWDEDDLACGGGDDRVCVNSVSSKISKSIDIRNNRTEDFSSEGTCTNSGTEKANISYSITIEATKTGFLTDGTWKVVTKEIKRGSGPWEELIPAFPACEIDNRYEFRKTGAYVVDEGATRCLPADPQIKNGNWAFQLGESRIRISLAGVPPSTIYNVEGIGKNFLRLISLPTMIGGVLTTTRIVYSH